jgi:hypothetical protein
MYMVDTHYQAPRPNIMQGRIRRLDSEIKIHSPIDAKLPNIYQGHYIFSIDKADRPFRSTYTGYYGLGVNKNFKNSHEGNVAYQLLKEKKIDHLVTALLSCEETINLHPDK